MLAPVPTVIVPPARMPSVDSGVLVLSTTVPVPVAGEGPEAAFAEALEAAPPDPLDDEPVLPEGCSNCSTSAVIWLLTRFRAVPLAMLAKPLPRFVSALLMALITEVVAAMALSACRACCQ